MKNLMTHFLVFVLFITTSVLVSAQSEDKKEKKEISMQKMKKKYERPYGMAGCGLGSIVVGKKGTQTSAATTNATSYSQMFGITSGTSNCIDVSDSEVAMSVDRFVAINRPSLQVDISRGKGETLSGLQTLLKCTGSSDQLGQSLQKHYVEIFSDPKAAPNEITDGIITVILNDETVSHHCPLG